MQTQNKDINQLGKANPELSYIKISRQEHFKKVTMSSKAQRKFEIFKIFKRF